MAVDGDATVATCVRRAKALTSSGCESRPASFAPAGSNQSSRGSNESAEASGVKGSAKELREHAGRNVSER